MVSIKEIVEKAGGANELAKALSITRPAVLHWISRGLKVPPIQHAEAIEIITGIPKEKIWTGHYKRMREIKESRS